ncbi:MAG TPA: SRPBCC family protein [Gammaproteobacteria bacterium]|jgi:uncharacterized protein YndB with AHSA1/START domain
MAAGKESKNHTKVERKSGREVVVTRTFDPPAHIVFQAWSEPELFKRWWVPKSLGMELLACEMDVRTGGGYRLTFRHPATKEPMVFFGKYIEVIPDSRMVWTNEESAEVSVTIVSFEEKAGKTLLVFHELHPSRQALDDSIGATEGMPEQFAQLDELLISLGASSK